MKRLILILGILLSIIFSSVFPIAVSALAGDQGSEWGVSLNPRVKVFLDYFFSPQRSVWRSNYSGASSGHLQRLAKELVNDSSLSFFDRATVAYWSRNKELIRKVIDEVESNPDLRNTLSANWLWTMAMLCSEIHQYYYYYNRAEYERLRELSRKYINLCAEKDPNWGMPQFVALTERISELLMEKVNLWQKEHGDKKDSLPSRDEFLAMISDEEVDFCLVRLRALLTARDFRHVLPPPWHRRISTDDDPPQEMARLRDLPPWAYRVGMLRAKDTLDFLTIKLLTRGDSTALSDVVRFCEKVEDMADLADVSPWVVTSFFGSFVSIFQEGCSDEVAKSKLVNIKDELKELVNAFSEKTKPLYQEQKNVKDEESGQSVEAELRKLEAECFSRLDVLIDEAVKIVESTDAEALHKPTPRKRESTPREPVEWSPDWERAWKLEIAPPIAEYVKWRILRELKGGGPSPTRWTEQMMRTDEAMAVCATPEELISVFWWGTAGRPSPDMTVSLVRSVDSACSSGMTPTTDELVAVPCFALDGFYWLNDEQVEEIYPVLEGFLKIAIEKEPLWALPRLAKIGLKTRYLEREAFRQRRGHYRGEFVYARIPDDAVYDLLWEIRQMTRARDYRVLLAPPWFSRIGTVAEIPEPLSWGILHQFAVVRAPTEGIFDATDIISDRLFRKRDWKGLADLLRWHASLLNYSPELVGVSYQATQAFKSVARQLEKERPLWAHLGELKDIVKEVEKLEEEIGNYPQREELRDLPARERIAVIEKGQLGKYAEIREFILRFAELLASEK